jgi:uncharacterized protein with NAD-binding domain and iron-sulfur cluster
MFPAFHIFKVQSDGSRRWMKAATNLEDANALMKMLAASSPGEYVITDLTGDKTSIKYPPKRIMFQIGYDEKALNARAELFRRVGHEVISVPDNEAAKHALASIKNVDVFVVGYKAPEQTRKEMVDWLKENFPKVKIVALVPSANLQLPRADHNIVLNDWEEWLSLLAATES